MARKLVVTIHLENTPLASLLERFELPVLTHYADAPAVARAIREIVVTEFAGEPQEDEAFSDVDKAMRLALYQMISLAWVCGSRLPTAELRRVRIRLHHKLAR
jgi:hypothetical protein